VLTNLIVNATDAYKEASKEKGEIGIEVSEDGDILEIRVKDQGCGIAPENKEKIFDELYSTKPLGEGTGLGLSIARNIVSNLFGGTIRLESQVGQGSMFILRLPRAQRREEGYAEGLAEGQPLSELYPQEPSLPSHPANAKTA